MGSSKPPDVVHPGEAAQAAMGTAAAGEMMSVANQSVDQYGNLLNTISLGPAAMQAQQALAGRAARQGAQQQMDIQSSVDPQAYAQRQMRMNAANSRLGKLYGVDPTAYVYNTPSNTYAVPGSTDLPDPVALARNAQSLSGMLSTGAVNKAGTNPILNKPGASQMAGAVPYTIPTSYLT
jgi:hypothetical protein